MADLNTQRKGNCDPYVSKILPPSASEIEEMQRMLAKEKRVIILSVTPGYAENYKPLELEVKLAPPLSDLFKSELEGLSRPALQERCEKILATPYRH